MIEIDPEFLGQWDAQVPRSSGLKSGSLSDLRPRTFVGVGLVELEMSAGCKQHDKGIMAVSQSPGATLAF
jgi:hypothetical protein